jgi:alkylation response protein AidB-like acyl-CoA dehydrogenase
VHFAFTAEQEDLRHLTRDVLDGFSQETLREIVDDPSRWVEIWTQLVEVGLPALAVPEDAGGAGLGAVELAAVAEIEGRYVLPAPLLSTMGLFVPAVVAAAGLSEPRALAAVANDGAVGTLGLPGAGTAFAGDQNRLRRTRLTATCDLVTEATRATFLAVVATNDAEHRRVVVVPSKIAEPILIGSLDPSRPIARIVLDGVEVDDAWILPGDPLPGLLAGLNTTAAELVGTASALVELSLEHARTRRQFGVLIGSFQAVKHRLVDAHVAVERARSLVYGAAVLLGEGQAELAAPAVHRARAAAAEAAVLAARTAVQVHGGLGVTWEHQISHLYLRARQSAALFGDATVHYLEAERARAGLGVAAEQPEPALISVGTNG